MPIRPDPLQQVNLFETAVVDVGTSAVVVGGIYKLGAILQNVGAAAIYLGGSSAVTTSGATQGFKLDAGATLSDERFQNLTKLYAIAGSGGQKLVVLGIS